MKVGDVRAEIADLLDTIESLNVYAEPPDRIEPPAAIVGNPDSVDYDGTYQRGMDRWVLPVVVLVKRTPAREAWNAIGEYADGSGPRSVKAVLEGAAGQSYDVLTVSSAEFDVVDIAGTPYAAAIFEVDVVGGGAD